MKVAWNRGIKTGPQSESTKQKKREAALQRDNLVYKGKVPWNKGKTANSDLRIALYASKQTGQKRTGNYKPKYHWRGAGNPWFGKCRSGNLSPTYKVKSHNEDYIDYKAKVAWLTELSYRKHKEILNPQGYSRTLAGVEDGYQLDHIFPVSKAFECGMSVEEVSAVENLQMLPWLENRKKWDN